MDGWIDCVCWICLDGCVIAARYLDGDEDGDGEFVRYVCIARCFAVLLIYAIIIPAVVSHQTSACIAKFIAPVKLVVV